MTRPVPRVAAVIPARGGSMAVHRKNLQHVGGRPLVLRAVDACRRSGVVDMIAVSTDDPEIAGIARDAGAVVVDRPAALSDGTATSESALLHALDALENDGEPVDILAFVQCTSPFVDPATIGSAVARVANGGADCVFSAVETYAFLWSVGPDGTADGVNHDPTTRPRRQDRDPHWTETGAFYVMRAEGFRRARHRFFGRIEVQPVAVADAIEIDTPEELDLARLMAESRREGHTMVEGVRALVTDFDGVHTDDRALIDENGAETVIVSRSDGHGVKLLREAGIPVLILSTEANPVVARRAVKLGVECRHAVDDKWSELQRWLDASGIDASEVAYVGNDVNDLECMRNVGTTFAVAGADARVLAAADAVTTRRGGAGAVREVAEAILESRGIRRRQLSPERPSEQSIVGESER